MGQSNCTNPWKGRTFLGWGQRKMQHFWLRRWRKAVMFARNVGSLWKLEKARTLISPYRLQKEHSPTFVICYDLENYYKHLQELQNHPHICTCLSYSHTLRVKLPSHLAGLLKSQLRSISFLCTYLFHIWIQLFPLTSSLIKDILCVLKVCKNFFFI